LFPTIRTLPGDSVTGHAPLVVIHALLAHGEPTPALPAEDKFPAAAVTQHWLFISPFFSSCLYFLIHYINNFYFI